MTAERQQKKPAEKDQVSDSQDSRAVQKIREIRIADLPYLIHRWRYGIMWFSVEQCQSEIN